MQKCAVYIRVSTEDQLEFSPDAQKRALLEYAKRNNYTINSEYIFIDEGISGRTAEKRPAFMEMISIAKTKPRPFDIILVHKFDRFARNREDSVVYKSLLRKECGIKVISISEHLEEDRFSIILEAMLEAMAEYYSLNLSDEVKKGMFEKARRGEHIGKAPFGYVLKEKNLYPHEREFPILQDIYSMYIEENLSISQIARNLNDLNIKTRQGKNWRVKTLSYIIENPVNCGYTRYNYAKKGSKFPSPKEEWIMAKSNHEPVISKETFDSLVKKREKEKSFRQKSYIKKNTESYLNKICRCSLCGNFLTISSSNKGKYKTFRCSGANHGNCSAKNTVSLTIIEKIISEEIRKNLSLADFCFELNPPKKQNSNRSYSLANSLKEIDGKLELLREAYLNKTDSLEEYERGKIQLLSEKLRIEQMHFDEENQMNIGKENKLFHGMFDIINDSKISSFEKNNIIKLFIKEINIDLIDKKINIVYFASKNPLSYN